MSIPRRISLPATLLAALSLLVLPACSDDDNPTGGGGGGGGTAEQQQMAALLGQAVLPVLQALSLQNYFVTPGLGIQDCTPLSVCGSGSAQSCTTVDGFVVTFNGCATDGPTLDGTISFTEGLSPGDYSGNMDLIIDQVVITGQFGYTIGQTCTSLFLSTSLSYNDRPYSLGGSLESCAAAAPGPSPSQGIDVPTSGSLTLFDSLGNRFTQIDFNVEEGQPGDFFAYVFQGETFLFQCEGNVIAGGIECYDPAL